MLRMYAHYAAVACRTCTHTTYTRCALSRTHTHVAHVVAYIGMHKQWGVSLRVYIWATLKSWQRGVGKCQATWSWESSGNVELGIIRLWCLPTHGWRSLSWASYKQRAALTTMMPVHSVQHLRTAQHSTAQHSSTRDQRLGVVQYLGDLPVTSTPPWRCTAQHSTKDVICTPAQSSWFCASNEYSLQLHSRLWAKLHFMSLQIEAACHLSMSRAVFHLPAIRSCMPPVYEQSCIPSSCKIELSRSGLDYLTVGGLVHCACVKEASLTHILNNTHSRIY